MKSRTYSWIFCMVLAVAATALFVAGCAMQADHANVAPSSEKRAPMGAYYNRGAPRAHPTATPDGAIDGHTQALAEAQPTDELWIISRPPDKDNTIQVAPDPDMPGAGTLAAIVPNSKKPIPLPLKHTDVKAAVEAYIATVDVTQQYHNPYETKIEAVYVFPLPQNAAVSDFVMTVGDRRIRGVIREKEEAQRIYYAARRQGYTASLLTQERPNIFTQRVANIEPGKNIDINIRYFNTLAWSDGWYEFVFPMVVGPRFNPASVGDQGIGAASRTSAGKSGQKTEVTYLRPSERSGHDLSLRVDLRLGVELEEMVCTSHQIEHATGNERFMHSVAIAKNDTLPNKDFVLRFRVGGGQLKTGLVVQPDPRNKDEGYFTLMMYPPNSLEKLQRQPVEMIFVLDCSGSMSGAPMAKSKEAMLYALQNMQPDDTFQVIRFSNNASALGPRPLPATDTNITRGIEYVKNLRGSGGTRMIEGIKAALDFPHDPKRLRVVAFLTDGYIGNEKEILGEMHNRLGPARVFSFGVSSSPNRYLLERMAKLGRGAVAYVGMKDDATNVMRQYLERTSHPAMTDVKIDWGDTKVIGVFPRRIPDVFVGRPVVVTGRYKGTPPSRVTVSGQAGGKTIAMPVRPQLSHVDHASGRNGAGSLAAIWARMQIADLVDQAAFTNDPQNELPDHIKNIALEYGLMSPYTAFVAVDSSRRTAGDGGTTVPVPVPVPEGVKYDTTVPE